MEKEAQEIIEDRMKKYGPPLQCHENIAVVWQGILENTPDSSEPCPTCKTTTIKITARHVALMLAAMKIVRESYHHDHDNIVDAKNYLQFAEDFNDN